MSDFQRLMLAVSSTTVHTPPRLHAGIVRRFWRYLKNKAARLSFLLGGSAVSPGHSMVARLDRCGGSGGTAVVATYNVESRGRVARQIGVGALAHLARHELFDVLPEKTFCMLLLVVTFQDQLPVTRDGALRAELRQHELQHMLRHSLHEAADLCEVDPPHLLGAHPDDLGRLHDVLLGCAQRRVLGLDDLVEPREHLVIGVQRPTLPSHRHDAALDGCAAFGDLTTAIFSIRLLLLFALLLFLHAEIELWLLLVLCHAVWVNLRDSKKAEVS